MPIVTIHVRVVREDWRRITAQQRKRKFEVWATEDRPYALYQTWDPWVASLCQRAHDLGRVVHLSIRETKFGPEIQAARLGPSDGEQV